MTSFIEKFDEKNRLNVEECMRKIPIGSHVRVKNDKKMYVVMGLSCKEKFDLKVVLVQIDDDYHVSVDEIFELNGEPFHYDQPSPGKDAEDRPGFVPTRHEYNQRFDVHYTIYVNYFREVCDSCYRIPIHIKVGRDKDDGNICCSCMCNLD